MSETETEPKYLSLRIPEICESNEHLKVAFKFRAYRLDADSTAGKLKEAEIVIDQLKNELNFSRDAEKNLRSQIISEQSRLLCLQEILKKFLTVTEQQRRNEKISQNIEQKLEEFREKIEQTRQETQNLFKCLTREIELLKKIKRLESELTTKGSEHNLLKMEIQTLTKEKKIMETEFQEKLKNLEEDLEKAVKREAETQAQNRDMSLYYKGQMEDYEKKIECYEKERKCLLEDFEPPNSSSHNIVWENSIATLKAQDGCLKTSNSKKRNKAEEESDELDTQVFQCSSIQGKPKIISFKKEKTSNFSRICKKQKPQLEFLTASQNSVQAHNSAEFGRKKRRLFSTNCNHYLD